MSCVECEGPLAGRQRKYCSAKCQAAYRVRTKPDSFGTAQAKRNRLLMHRYGITDEQYQQILAYQGGGCAVCGKPEPANKKHCIDHDHKTGLVRGVLCLRCNLYVLGKLTLEQITAAHEYLTNPPAQKVIGLVVAPGKPTRRKRKRAPRKAQAAKQAPMKKVWGFR